MNEDQRPVLIGWAQLVQRDTPPAQALSPLDMLARVARDAARDAGAGERALRELDTVALVDAVGWRAANAPGLLAEQLGAHPKRELLSAVGGEMPLVLVNRIARQIAAGDVGLALVAGAHPMHTRRRAQNARIKLRWPHGGAGAPEVVGITRGGTSPAEVEYGLAAPSEVYPIFENALRARRGASLAEHQRQLGELMAPFSRVAAAHPCAWFPVERSAEEIATPSERNRRVSFPYTKYMNAMMDTDQAAGVLMASAATARRLGVPEARWVHWWGGASAEEEVWYPTERADFTRSEAQARASREALAEAGVTVGELGCIDLYSCFPVAVEMACEALGLAPDDPRGLTVTGGLPYFGGPGNNYTLHSLATVAGRLREGAAGSGLVTGNGWYVTKHAATVLGAAPRHPGELKTVADPPPRAVVEATRSTDPAAGPARVETYTLHYDRDGGPSRCVVVGRTDAGQRFVANTPEDRGLLEDLARRECVGLPGRVGASEGRNVFEPA